MSELGENIRLGVFDINGTIHSDEYGVPEEINTGFEALHKININTTIVTGRGIIRARELLGADWPTIVSPNMPMSAENGSRLLSPDGRNLKHYTLHPDEITEAVDVFESIGDEIKYLAYYPKDPTAGAVLWATDIDAILDFAQNHGQFGEMQPLSMATFASRVASDRASMIIVGAKPSKVESEFSGSNIIANGRELNILPEGIDKSTGLEAVAEATGLSLYEILVAGNDHNDLSMLELPVGKSLCVDGIGLEMPKSSDIEIVTSPKALGRWLSMHAKSLGI